MSFLLFATSGDHVTIDPHWDFDRKDAQIKNEHITRSGKRYVYKWGSYCKFSFTVSFVNSRGASLINSWWITNTKLRFFDEADPASVFSVMIVASDLPMGKYQKPYTNLFTGKIELQGY